MHLVDSIDKLSLKIPQHFTPMFICTETVNFREIHSNFYFPTFAGHNSLYDHIVENLVEKDQLRFAKISRVGTLGPLGSFGNFRITIMIIEQGRIVLVNID